MHRLWTPWRMRYVGGERSPGCVFCNAIEHPEDRQSLVLHVGERVFLILNRFPYNSGHVMIVPIEHVPSIEDLDPETRAEMMELANVAMRVSRAVFRCDGFNLGLNVGQVAGAGIADHMHMHLVPRWMGDANFMPILSDTMVLPETLDATYARLRAELVIDTARSTGSNLEVAAGALVYTSDANVFALRQVDAAPAVLPKGKLEDSETAAEAAMREVREETGLDATIVGWLGAQVIPAAKEHRPEQCAVFFLATTSDLSSLIERDTILICPDDLLDAITIPELRDMLSIAMPAIRLMVGEG